MKSPDSMPIPMVHVPMDGQFVRNAYLHQLQPTGENPIVLRAPILPQRHDDKQVVVVGALAKLDMVELEVTVAGQPDTMELDSDSHKPIRIYGGRTVSVQRADHTPLSVNVVTTSSSPFGEALLTHQVSRIVFQRAIFDMPQSDRGPILPNITSGPDGTVLGWTVPDETPLSPRPGTNHNLKDFLDKIGVFSVEKQARFGQHRIPMQ